MITREHATALQAWARSIDYTGRELYVDGVDCSDLAAVAGLLSPEELARTCRRRVERARRAKTLVT